MGIIAGLWLAVLGVLGAANLIIAKKPEAKELIAKLTPYQGWIGALSALWGAWTVINAVLNLGWLGHIPIWWITYLATGLVQLLLGFILGIGILKSFVGGKPGVAAKMDEFLVKLAPKQGMLGIVAIVLGIWCIIARVTW